MMLRIIDGGRTDPPKRRRRRRTTSAKVRGLTIGTFDNGRFAVTPAEQK